MHTPMMMPTSLSLLPVLGTGSSADTTGRSSSTPKLTPIEQLRPTDYLLMLRATSWLREHVKRGIKKPCVPISEMRYKNIRASFDAFDTKNGYITTAPVSTEWFMWASPVTPPVTLPATSLTCLSADRVLRVYAEEAAERAGAGPGHRAQLEQVDGVVLQLGHQHLALRTWDREDGAGHTPQPRSKRRNVSRQPSAGDDRRRSHTAATLATPQCQPSAGDDRRRSHTTATLATTQCQPSASDDRRRSHTTATLATPQCQLSAGDDRRRSHTTATLATPQCQLSAGDDRRRSHTTATLATPQCQPSAGDDRRRSHTTATLATTQCQPSASDDRRRSHTRATLATTQCQPSAGDDRRRSHTTATLATPQCRPSAGDDRRRSHTTAMLATTQCQPYSSEPTGRFANGMTLHIYRT